MTTSSERPPASTQDYSEKLRTPLYWYVVALFVAALLVGEFHVAHHSFITDWIPGCVLLPGSLVVVWSLGRSKLEIKDGELRIRGAHIPLSDVSGVVALDPATLRRVVGREGDPAAFVSIRAWIGPGVQLWVDDPEDPTPYWVVSSRHPQQVVDIVRARASR
ncbi:DUF3093 domain-containing protein [Jatrophihabitans sp.]|uniref:DUF3093 domain-containing protein n=1 Tax=Jatrophihabitans sp. TaxID=1932789 RepID=UPI0030C65E80|nr:transrane protein [Jatrophihabitans sp.]